MVGDASVESPVGRRGEGGALCGEAVTGRWWGAVVRGRKCRVQGAVGEGCLSVQRQDGQGRCGCCGGCNALLKRRKVQSGASRWAVGFAECVRGRGLCGGVWVCLAT